MLPEDFGCVGVRGGVGMDVNAAIGIVQQRGLNKLRHVELDVLCIQEQQARILLPLGKVPGPRNPSDMMTKNVGQAHIDMYFDLPNSRFDVGRADIAQNHHSMGGKPEQSRATAERAKPITSDTGIPTRTLRTVFANCPEPPIA